MKAKYLDRNQINSIINMTQYLEDNQVEEVLAAIIKNKIITKEFMREFKKYVTPEIFSSSANLSLEMINEYPNLFDINIWALSDSPKDINLLVDDNFRNNLFSIGTFKCSDSENNEEQNNDLSNLKNTLEREEFGEDINNNTIIENSEKIKTENNYGSKLVKTNFNLKNEDSSEDSVLANMLSSLLSVASGNGLRTVNNPTTSNNSYTISADELIAHIVEKNYKNITKDLFFNLVKTLNGHALDTLWKNYKFLDEESILKNLTFLSLSVLDNPFFDNIKSDDILESILTAKKLKLNDFLRIIRKSKNVKWKSEKINNMENNYYIEDCQEKKNAVLDNKNVILLLSNLDEKTICSLFILIKKYSINGLSRNILLYLLSKEPEEDTLVEFGNDFREAGLTKELFEYACDNEYESVIVSLAVS